MFNRKFLSLILIFHLLFGLIPLVSVGEINSNESNIYHVTILLEMGENQECEYMVPIYINYDFNLTLEEQIDEKKFLNTDWGWKGYMTSNVSGIFPFIENNNSTLNQSINVTKKILRDNIKELASLPVKFAYSCIKVADVWSLIPNVLRMVNDSSWVDDLFDDHVGSTKEFDELGISLPLLDPITYGSELTIESDWIETDKIDPEEFENLNNLDNQLSDKIGMLVEFAGELKRKYKLNGTSYDPNLDINNLLYIEYRHNWLNGINLQISINGERSGLNINYKLIINIEKDGGGFSPKKPSKFDPDLIRIWLVKYPLITIIAFIGVVILVIFLFKRRKIKRKEKIKQL